VAGGLGGGFRRSRVLQEALFDERERCWRDLDRVAEPLLREPDDLVFDVLHDLLDARDRQGEAGVVQGVEEMDDDLASVLQRGDLEPFCRVGKMVRVGVLAHVRHAITQAVPVVDIHAKENI
jgi:hypothetical protein